VFSDISDAETLKNGSKQCNVVFSQRYNIRPEIAKSLIAAVRKNTSR